MKKRFLILSLIFSILVTCTAFAADPIKIGVLEALTGEFAPYGLAELESAQMTVADINAAGGILGRLIELVPYDTKSSNEDAVNAVRRMIDNDKVVAILGANSSGINLATAPLVTKAKIPQLSTSATNPLLTVDESGKLRPYSFRICFTDPYQGVLAAQLAVNTLKRDKAAVLYNVGSDYAQAFREYFTKEYTRLGGTIVADEAYRDNDVDFRSQLTNIKNINPNLLFIPGMGKDMALIIKQARELGLSGDSIDIVGGDGFNDFMAEIAGDALEGTYFVNHLYPADPAIQPALEQYRQVYKKEPMEWGNVVMMKDLTYWLVDAIKRAGVADGEAIAKQLGETKDLKLDHVTLTISQDDHNPVNKPGVILRVGDDLRPHFFAKIEPK